MKKPSFNVETKKRSTGNQLPPKGAYIGEIKNVIYLSKEKDNVKRDRIELYIDITEGEYAGRFRQVFDDQQERFGKTTYKGIFRINIPIDGEEYFDRILSALQSNLWCVEQSNDGYHWDWDEKKLKGKKVGFSLRNRLYTYDGKDRETVEIAQLETIDDVRNGKCKVLKDRDQREKKDEQAEESADESSFTDVSSDVSVPW